MIPRAVGPTEDSPDGEFARKLADAIGSALQASDDTAAAADLLALGGALADARQLLRDALDEAFPDTAYDLLSEWERALGLPAQPELSAQARRDRLVAKVRAARAGTQSDILTAVRALDATASIYENTPATVPQPPTPGADDTLFPTPRAGDKRLVFLWALRVAETVWNDSTMRARVDALCDQMQPAHTDHSIHTNDPALGFRFGFDKFGMGAWFTV